MNLCFLLCFVGLQTGGGLSLTSKPPQTITSSSGTTTTNLQTTNSGLALTQTVAPLGQQTTATKTTSTTTNGGLKLGVGLPGPNGLKLGSSTGGSLQLGTTTATLSSGQGLGLGGFQTGLQTTTTATKAVSLGVTSTTGTTTAFKGLGGIDPSSTAGKGTGNDKYV